MWTMILADDEPIIIHGLQKIVNWEQLGIRVVGTGVDGVSALALILKHQPDLAILDINMPGKNRTGNRGRGACCTPRHKSNFYQWISAV